jgi:hypothetical protein
MDAAEAKQKSEGRTDPDSTGFSLVEWYKPEHPHNPLSDAEAQLKNVQKAYSILGIRPKPLPPMPPAPSPTFVPISA